MNPAIIPLIGSAVGKLIDRAVKDKDKAEEIKKEIALDIQDIERTELKGAIDIIIAEAKGESSLQRNWRPVTMLALVFLVACHWLGFTPENLTESAIEGLFQLVQIGLGGYVIGRSGEKIMKEYKQ